MKMKSTVRIITAMIIATMTFIVSNSVNVLADEDKEIQLEVLDGEFELNDENSLDNTEPLDQIDYSDDIVLSDIESREIVMTTSDAGEEGDGWSYDSSTQTVTVTKEYIILPDAIRSEVKSVVYEGDAKGVCSYAWQGCEKLESVILSDKVSEIGDYAFNGCTNLKSIELPDGFRIIKRFAFKNSGITSIELPDSIVLIEESVFLGCADLKTADLSEITLDKVSFSLFASCENLEKVILPDGIKIIYAKAFYECKKLKEINMPANLVKIDGNAFAGCENLEEVELPDGLTVCGESIFSECTHLKKVTFPDNEEFTSISNKMFYNCSLLGNTEEGLTIPESVTSIADYAFYGCSSLGISKEKNSEDSNDTDDEDIDEDGYGEEVTTWEVVIPDSVTKIGQLAFSHCDGMESVILPNNPEFTMLNQETFSYCTNLKNIKIPNNVAAISVRVFYECSNLESVELPANEKYTSIGSNLFENCTNLKKVEIPKNINTIGYAAFKGCSGLKKIIIPDSIKTVDSYAFYGCSSLVEVKLPNNEEFITIGYRAFMYCSSLEEIYIPDSVTSLGEDSFSWCDKLTKIYGGMNCVKFYNSCFKCKKKTETMLTDESGLQKNYWRWSGNDNRVIVRKFKYYSSYCTKPGYATSANAEDHERTAERTAFQEAWFAAPNTKARHRQDDYYEFTKLSFQVAMSAFDFANGQDERHTGHIREMFDSLGMTYDKINDIQYGLPETHSIGSAIGHRVLNNGKDVLVTVAIRGAGYEKEWGGNFIVFDPNVKWSKEEESYGFKTAANAVMKRLDDHLERYEEEFEGKNVKYWVVGYSRGGATANLVSSYLINRERAAEVENSRTGVNVYGFCFECPQTTTRDEAGNQEYEDGIVSIVSPQDIVPRVPMNNEDEWNYRRYGETFSLPSISNMGTDYWVAMIIMRDYFRSLFPDEDIDIPVDNGKVEMYGNVLTKKLADSTGKRFYGKSQDWLSEQLAKLLGGISKNTSPLKKKLINESLIDIISGAIAMAQAADNKMLFPVVVNVINVPIRAADINMFEFHNPEVNYAWFNAVSQAKLTKVKYTREGYVDFYTHDTLLSSSGIGYEMLKAAKELCNLTIYEEANSVVGKIENGIPAEIENGIYVDVIDNNQLYFALPGDTEYHVELDSDAEGSVSLAIVEKVSVENVTKRVVTYTDVPLTEGASLDVTVGVVDEFTGETEYRASANNENEVVPTANQKGGAIKRYVVNVDTKGDGIAVGGGSYTYGLHAQLLAVPNEGSDFVGWKIGEKIISTEEEFYYNVTEDVTVTAVFGKTDSASEKIGKTTDKDNQKKVEVIERNTEKGKKDFYVFPFKDVATNAWYYDAVRYVNYNGIMDGTGNGTTFSPGDKCTREMVVQILYNAEGRNSVDRNNPFDDVKKGKWYYNSILWGLDNGITEGTSATTFGVGKSVTRQEMAGFLYNYSKWKGYPVDDVKELDEFDDANEVSGWAVDKMKWAVANGIINGKSKGGRKLLDPKGTATRAEVAQMIKNYRLQFE